MMKRSHPPLGYYSIGSTVIGYNMRKKYQRHLNGMVGVVVSQQEQYRVYKIKFTLPRGETQTTWLAMCNIRPATVRDQERTARICDTTTANDSS